MKTSYIKIIFIFITYLIIFTNSYAQLKIYPEQIEYKSRFERLQNVDFINTGNQTLTIDTIYYKSDLYTVRFDTYNQYPFTISAGDTLKMDCILSGHFYVTQSDSTDSLTIKFNSSETAIVKIKIDFFETLKEGTISGKVISGLTPVSGAFINFYYNGTYVLKSTQSDSNGNYSVALPVGDYKVSVQKYDYELYFFNSKVNPIEADKISVTENSADTLEFNLKHKSSTGISVSGFILDKSTAARINRGIVVIRKGKHTPSKIFEVNGTETYSTPIDYDGSYSFNNLNAGYYYIQSFSDFYVPSFYSQSNPGVFYWQQSDSVNISGSLTNFNISMLRDSSFGAGSIAGKVSISNSVTNLYSDVIVYAQSVTGGFPLNYSFVDSTGNYSINDLQYGSYTIIAQKIGFEDAVYSSEINIDQNSYLIENIDLSIVTGIIGNKIIPAEFVLYQNYPNPFNPSTTISFQIDKTSIVKLKVSNILGQEIAELQNGELFPGNYKYTFNAKNLSSGIYFIYLSSNENVQVKKMILIK